MEKKIQPPIISIQDRADLVHEIQFLVSRIRKHSDLFSRGDLQDALKLADSAEQLANLIYLPPEFSTPK